MQFIKKYWWVIVLIVLLFVVFVVVSQNELLNNIKPRDLSLSKDRNISNDGWTLSNGKCQGEAKPKLDALPMNYDDFSMIMPYGMVIDDHITPIDHQYFSPTVFNSPRDKYPVFAMADATITDIQPRTTERGIEYRLVFSMSCKLFYYYDLVTSLSPDIETQKQKQGGRQQVNIKVAKGQEIGRIGGQTLDFAVWDMDVELKGFVDPEGYRKVETWKTHTADPLNYYTDELKQKILSKYIRTAEPVSGKIDYDEDGKLIGTWFLQDTGGYGGKGQNGYFEGHLSIVPDFVDPTSIVISFGNYSDRPRQFGVKGNAPDPASITLNSGLVKYELVDKEWIDSAGKPWDRKSFSKGFRANNGTMAQGVVLLELLENRKLKVEIFPRKTGSQVSAFTPNAKIYER